MKRYLVCTVVLFFLLSFSYANAVLLGVRDVLGWPVVQYNTSGEVNFVMGGELVVSGWDKTLTHSPGDEDTLTFSGIPNVIDPWRTDFNITMYVDEHGDLDLTRPATMREWVTLGTVPVRDKNGNYHYYGEDTTLIAGDVVLFGWADTVAGPAFDFAISNDSLTGVFVEELELDIWDVTYDTGITCEPEIVSPGSENWFTWSDDFHMTLATGFKAPATSAIPEPGMLLLLGSGLIGLAGYARLKRKKSSEG